MWFVTMCFITDMYDFGRKDDDAPTQIEWSSHDNIHEATMIKNRTYSDSEQAKLDHELNMMRMGMKDSERQRQLEEMKLQIQGKEFEMTERLEKEKFQMQMQGRELESLEKDRVITV